MTAFIVWLHVLDSCDVQASVTTCTHADVTGDTVHPHKHMKCVVRPGDVWLALRSFCVPLPVGLRGGFLALASMIAVIAVLLAICGVAWDMCTRTIPSCMLFTEQPNMVAMAFRCQVLQCLRVGGERNLCTNRCMKLA
jgi:hypothetical protein